MSSQLQQDLLTDRGRQDMRHLSHRNNSRVVLRNVFLSHRNNNGFVLRNVFPTMRTMISLLLAGIAMTKPASVSNFCANILLSVILLPPCRPFLISPRRYDAAKSISSQISPSLKPHKRMLPPPLYTRPFHISAGLVSLRPPFLRSL